MNDVHRHDRRGQTVLVIVVILVLLVVAALGYRGLVLKRGDRSAGSGQSDIFVVKRGSFDMTIPANGELAALQQIEIRSQLESEATIIEIVDEGKTVKKGDVLMRFADEQLQTKVKDAIDDVNVADAAAVAAKAELEIKSKERESNIAKADLAIQLAELALMGWREGEDKSKRQELQLDLETANKEYDRLVARYEASKTLVEKEYISRDELKTDEIEMIRAKSAAEQAKLAMEVYEKYEFPQEKAKRESDLDQARQERDRVMQQADAEVRSAQSDLESKTYQLESKKERLARWQQQLSYCTVAAPSAGLVVYGSSLENNGWRNDGQPPQVGTKVFPNERVMVLPDTSRIVAAVKVNEAISGQIQPGQLAMVTSDALPGIPLHGVVQSIGVLAESGGWRDPNRRDYTVKILLDGENSSGLKPSMRCKAEISVGTVSNSLHAPIQAVFRRQGTAFAYVRDGSGWAEREIQVGQSSELYVEVLGGLAEAETVLLREPKAGEITSQLAARTEGLDSREPSDADDEQRAPRGRRSDGQARTARGENRDSSAEQPAKRDVIADTSEQSHESHSDQDQSSPKVEPAGKSEPAVQAAPQDGQPAAGSG